MSRRRFREADAITFDFAPMVDVVLLLLIFFFLTSSLTKSGEALPLDLPNATETVQETPGLPVVAVAADGSLTLGGEPTTLAALKTQLPPLVAASGGLVGLRADKNGDYGTVVEVMNAIKAAGGERLALGTSGSPSGDGSSAGGTP